MKQSEAAGSIYDWIFAINHYQKVKYYIKDYKITRAKINLVSNNNKRIRKDRI